MIENNNKLLVLIQKTQKNKKRNKIKNVDEPSFSSTIKLQKRQQSKEARRTNCKSSETNGELQRRIKERDT